MTKNKDNQLDLMEVLQVEDNLAGKGGNGAIRDPKETKAASGEGKNEAVAREELPPLKTKPLDVIAMKISDYAALTGRSTSAVYRWMGKGVIGKAEIMGHTYVWITENHVEKYEQALTALGKTGGDLVKSKEWRCNVYRSPGYWQLH